MKKFVLGIVVGLVAAILFIVVLAAVVVKLGKSNEPSIASNSALVLNLDGDLPETPPVEIDIPFLSSQTAPTVREMWTSLHAAAKDDRIKAIVLEPHSLSLGWAKLQELRAQITAFKQSGKPVYAYLRAPGMREYYLASVADKIYLEPDDFLDVKGLRLETMYLKGTLDKLGVTFEVDHIGKYKDAGDMFTRNNMSPETREVLNGVLDQIYSDFCATTAASRHKSGDELRALVDQGPFLAAQAKSAGLVDQLGYEDQLYGDLKSALKSGDLRKTNYNLYIRATPRGDGTRIALLAGEGDIVRGAVDDPFGQQQVIASQTFAKQIEQVRRDNSIKGVIVRVDSPGGDAVASDEILHELKLLSKAKPVVISMSDLAASGGYFISMTGDPVVAYPNTITGSIGVLYGKPNLHGLYDKLGIQKELLTRGKLADIDSDYTNLSEAGHQKLHEGIVATYKSFVTKVSTARKKPYDQIDSLAQGRVWMGAAAKNNGLVDELGGLDKAVELIRQKAKIPTASGISLVPYPPHRSLLSVLMNSSFDSMADAQTESRARKILGPLPSRALLRGGVLELMPFRVSIQ